MTCRIFTSLGCMTHTDPWSSLWSDPDSLSWPMQIRAKLSPRSWKGPRCCRRPRRKGQPIMHLWAKRPITMAAVDGTRAMMRENIIQRTADPMYCFLRPKDSDSGGKKMQARPWPMRYLNYRQMLRKRTWHSLTYTDTKLKGARDLPMPISCRVTSDVAVYRKSATEIHACTFWGGLCA